MQPHPFRLRAVSLTLTLTVAGCLGLTGCNESSGAPPKETASSAPAATEQPVPPAAGPVVDEELFRFHVPDGWKVGGDFDADFFTPASTSTPEGSQQITVGSIPVGTQPPFDETAKGSLQTFLDVRKGVGGKGKLVTPVDIDGQRFHHIAGTNGPYSYADEFGTVRGQTMVTLTFETPVGRTDRQQLIDSVLASWEWK